MTVDYYENNELVIRLGDNYFVMDAVKSDKRTNAPVLTEKNGLQWKVTLTKTNLTIGKILDHLMIIKPKDFS